MISRRTALASLATSFSGFASNLFQVEPTDWGAFRTALYAGEQAQASRSTMGLVSYCCGLRRRWQMQQRPAVDLHAPAQLLEHCREIGAGGMQTALGVLSESDATRLRRQAEEEGLFIEAIINVPRDAGDVDRFRTEVQTAKWCGALAFRTVVMPGRRYERFNSLQEFHEYTDLAMRSLERAALIVDNLKLPLAVENHKDHRWEQRVEMLRKFSSEYMGACVDTGNNIALLDDPLETVRQLAPWAKSVHLKDQAVAPDESGFLLADIPLGQGYLPLAEMIALLRTANPSLRFNLELITRDPLSVPVWSEKYWATFPDLPARELACTMRDVHRHAHSNLPQVSSRPLEQQVALEDAQVQQSLEFARTQLGLVR